MEGARTEQQDTRFPLSSEARLRAGELPPNGWLRVSALLF